MLHFTQTWLGSITCIKEVQKGLWFISKSPKLSMRFKRIIGWFKENSDSWSGDFKIRIVDCHSNEENNGDIMLLEVVILNGSANGFGQIMKVCMVIY